MKALRNLDRRWLIAIVSVLVVGVAFVVSEVVYRGTSEECRPVRDLLDFNQSQAELISRETNDQADVPTVADDSAYQQWADGLAQRAQQVTDPDLAGTSVRVANLATQFVTKLPRLRAESQAHTPGAPTPPLVHEMDFLNARISQEIAELAEACPE